MKRAVQSGDNFGIYNETMTGLDDIFDFLDYQFNNMTYLRATVKRNGDWERFFIEEMTYEK